jgi:predicted dehydrogenase
MTYLSVSLPSRVFASAMKDSRNLDDVLSIVITYQDGTIGNICYFSNGDKGLPKERLEIFAHGTTAVIDDFKTLTLYAGGRVRKKSLMSQDKGQEHEVKSFIRSIMEGSGDLIPFDELLSTSSVTFGILESIRTGESVNMLNIS